MNKCSEVKYGVFRIEVKSLEGANSKVHQSSAQVAGLLNKDAGFEPITSTAGKRQCITNVAESLPLYHHSPPCDTAEGNVIHYKEVMTLSTYTYNI